MLLTILVFLLVGLTIVSIAFLTVRFILNFTKYKYIGNAKIYAITAFGLCLLYSLFAALHPATGLVKASLIAPKMLNSIFDALKMMVGSFKSDDMGAYLGLKEVWATSFAIAYIATSLFSLLASSLSVIALISKSAGAKMKNSIDESHGKDVVYIFTEKKVDIAIRLASKLRDSGDVVRIILPTSEEKAKDSLIKKKYDVWCEDISSSFFCLLLKKSWKENKKRNVSIYGLFSNDDTSIKFANQFKLALLKNPKFIRIKKEFDSFKDNGGEINLTNNDFELIKSLKVFVSYQEFDCECMYRYTSETLGMMTTFSQYDIISTNFIMSHPISDFFDLKKAFNEEKENDNKGLNVSFLGFGSVNQQIFTKMASAYQLFGDNINKINYRILDINAKKLAKRYSDVYSNDNPLGRMNGKLPYPKLYNIIPECEVDLNNRTHLDEYIDQVISQGEERFRKDGFELFIISAGHSSSSARIAFFLRKALMSKIAAERLKHSYIFVRIGNRDILDVYKESNDFVFTEKEFANNEHSCLLPIISFGEDSLISDYIHNHLNRQLAIASKINQRYLGEGVKEKEAVANFLMMDKEGIVNNTSVLWQIKPKLSIFDLALSEDYRIINKEDGSPVSFEEFKSKLGEVLPNPIDSIQRSDTLIGKRLLEMEHNRWLASNNQLYGYYPYPFEDYMLNPKKTKNVVEAKHICMTDNAGLKVLEKEVVFRFKDDEEIKRRIANVVYYNDVFGLYYLFESLS